jgi:hypothetical protein
MSPRLSPGRLRPSTVLINRYDIFGVGAAAELRACLSVQFAAGVANATREADCAHPRKGDRIELGRQDFTAGQG